MFAYCGNNPVMLTDHTGHCACAWKAHCPGHNLSYKQDEAKIKKNSTPAVKPIQQADSSTNCYSYALRVVKKNINIEFRKYDPGTIEHNGDKKYAAPDGSSANTVLSYVINDLDYLEWTYTTGVKANTPIPAGSSMLALRVGTVGGRWDYHFMAKNSSDSNWSFKGGVDGPVFQVADGLTPNDISWDNYKLENDSWVTDKANRYTGTIEYVMITP